MLLPIAADVSRLRGEPSALFAISCYFLLLPVAIRCHSLLPAMASPTISFPQLHASLSRASPPLKPSLSASACPPPKLPDTNPEQAAPAARKRMLKRNRLLPKRQGFAFGLPPCCRFFAAIAPAPQRGVTPENT